MTTFTPEQIGKLQDAIEILRDTHLSDVSETVSLLEGILVGSYCTADINDAIDGCDAAAMLLRYEDALKIEEAASILMSIK